MAGCVTYWLRASGNVHIKAGWLSRTRGQATPGRDQEIKKSRLQADLHFLITGGATYQGWDGKYFSLKYFVEIRDKSKPGEDGQTQMKTWSAKRLPSRFFTTLPPIDQIG